jgi:hypothetical protein
MMKQEMTMLTVVLDSVRRDRASKDEYRMVPRATALGVEVVGDGTILRNLLTELVAAGKVERTDLVRVMRGTMSCFADGTTVGKFVCDPERAMPWKPWEARRKKTA